MGTRKYFGLIFSELSFHFRDWSTLTSVTILLNQFLTICLKLSRFQTSFLMSSAQSFWIWCHSRLLGLNMSHMTEILFSHNWVWNSSSSWTWDALVLDHIMLWLPDFNISADMMVQTFTEKKDKQKTLIRNMVIIVKNQQPFLGVLSLPC